MYVSNEKSCTTWEDLGCVGYFDGGRRKELSKNQSLVLYVEEERAHVTTSLTHYLQGWRVVKLRALQKAGRKMTLQNLFYSPCLKARLNRPTERNLVLISQAPLSNTQKTMRRHKIPLLRFLLSKTFSATTSNSIQFKSAAPIFTVCMEGSQ